MHRSSLQGSPENKALPILGVLSQPDSLTIYLPDYHQWSLRLEGAPKLEVLLVGKDF